MRELSVLLAHLVTTLIKLCQHGGLHAVVAESLAVKHQLQVINRTRRRAPRLTPWDRVVFGLCAAWIPLKRLAKCAVILKPFSFMRFHQALVRCKYRWLEEIKSVPFVPQSHPFVERLIGTLRREYLDHLFFWNGPDLEQKLLAYRDYYNQHRCHTGLSGETPNGYGTAKAISSATIGSYEWLSHCHGMFYLPAAG